MENTLSPLSQALDKVSEEGLVLTISTTSEGIWQGTLYGSNHPVEVVGITLKEMLEAAGMAIIYSQSPSTVPH